MEINVVILDKRILNRDYSFIKKNLSESEHFKFRFINVSNKKIISDFNLYLNRIRKENYQNKIHTNESHKSLLDYLNKIDLHLRINNSIYLTQFPLPSNFFSIYNNENRALITLNSWDNFSPPPQEVFLTKEIITYCLLFLRKTKRSKFFHEKTKSCLFDSCISNKNHMIAGLWGRICYDCTVKLKSLSVNRSIIEDSLKIIQNCWKYNFEINDNLMKIRPNPHLLDSKDYKVIPNQIFVALSWKLIDNVYIDLKESLKQFDYNVVNAEDKLGQIVFKDIWQLMNQSELVIVDFTDQRPNVYLEFGMALVLGKPLIVLVQDKKDLPSDVPGIRWLKYENRKGDKTFTKDLPKMINDTLSDY